MKSNINVINVVILNVVKRVLTSFFFLSGKFIQIVLKWKAGSKERFSRKQKCDSQRTHPSVFLERMFLNIEETQIYVHAGEASFHHHDPFSSAFL